MCGLTRFRSPQKCGCKGPERRACETGRVDIGRLDLDPQLFAQFADQGGLWKLTLIHLAPREFPEARQRLAGRSLRDQHPLVDVDQRAGDDQSEF